VSLPKDFRWKPAGSELGRGGQAAVIPVEDSTGVVKGTWALKSLKNDAPKKSYDRFYREISAIKSIDHPGVIKIVDHSDSDAHFHYYVMELHEGAKSLKKLIQTGQNGFYRDALKSLNLFKQLADVVDAVQEKSVVHRDLSPGNVLVLSDESIKAIDFGLCQIEGEQTITLADEGVGTINYMSPECEAGAEDEVSFKSDLYSAGKITWSAITNQFAFSRESAVFNSKSLYSLFPDNPDTWHLHHVFEKTIRQRAADRFESTQEALLLCKRLHEVIRAGYPALELIAKRCPICGFGRIRAREHDANVSHPFRNPLPDDVSAVQCDYCGFWLAVDNEKFFGTIRGRKSLQ
jgi:serine/threonine protein kinase